MATGSNLPRRLLGRQLEQLRVQAGVTMEAAAATIAVAKSTLWRIETGQPVRLNPVLLERLCLLYNASSEMTGMLLSLIEETKTKGWWHAFSDSIPKDFSFFVSLEDAAVHETSFQTTFLPGLLHTPDYKRNLIWAEFPNMPPAEVDRMLAVGMRRQDRLTSADRPIRFDVLLDEAVLRRVVGGPAVMADQMRHLATLSEMPHVSLRVVPASTGPYLGLIAGTFVLLEFPRHPKADLSMPPVVYVQGFTGDLYLEKETEVAQYREVCAEINRRALDDERSRALITSTAEEYSA